MSNTYTNFYSNKSSKQGSKHVQETFKLYSESPRVKTSSPHVKMPLIKEDKLSNFPGVIAHYNTQNLRLMDKVILNNN